MFKIRSIRFIEHPILGNLYLSFEGLDNKTVDTVILAGENGTGKSAVLNALFGIVSRNLDFEADVELEEDDSRFTLEYRWNEASGGKRMMHLNDRAGINRWVGSSNVQDKYPTVGIFSDVDINFHSKQISSVTSSMLDEGGASRRSSSDLPTEVNQLIVDIQALDDAEVAQAVRKNPGLTVDQLNVVERMPRFTRAFNLMFENLRYSHIENRKGGKVILFKKTESQYQSTSSAQVKNR